MFLKKKIKEEVINKTIENRVEVSVLNKQQYELLEKSIGHMSVTDKTSANEVSYMLGIQFVLRKLREGFVSQ